jgi:hypothetical protein
MVNFDFVQGALWTCFFLGTWNMVIKPNLKLSMFLKLLQIVSETLKKKSNGTLNIRQEDKLLRIEMLNNVVYLPTLSSSHMFEVVCYQDTDHTIKIPITFFQYKNRYVYVPFKPSDLSLPHIYLGIKHLIQDSYIFFVIDQDDFIDIPSLLLRYETELEDRLANEPLAEAFDE